MPQPSGTLAVARSGFGIADLALPVAILLAALVVLAPVPPAIVDLMLAANLTVAVLALLGALAVRTPMELSVFPSFLLGATLVRLVLNIATTRLILSRAAVDGPLAAGQVVAAFGEYVAANHLVVGGVVFAIIAVVQFVVITAGSTRTSEVAARFALDGLPGRQMAIDNEMQAGTLSREQARQLRVDLQRQADFFASMDGASRFVRGEAVASVIITLVNVIGGLGIGVIEHGLPIAKAAGIYARLTIGDGLASAIPALFVSVATALLISRSTHAVDLPREFGRQFTARPHVLAVTGVFLGLLALTDLPFLPLASLAAVLLGAALVTARNRGVADAEADRGSRSRTTVGGGPQPPEVSRASSATEELFADERLVVALGRGLVPLVAGRGPLLEAVADLRKRIAGDLGFLVPQVAFRDDLALPDRGFQVLVHGELRVEATVPAGRLLALPRPGGRLSEVAGEPTDDLLDGRPGLWVGHAAADTLRRQGGIVLDEVAMVVRALEAAVRRHADRLLSREDASRLVESLRATHPGLVEQVVPAIVTPARLHRALQSLLAEGVPVRPLSEVLETMSDHADEAVEPWQLAEFVRRRVAEAICRRARDPDGRLTVVRLAGPALDACVAAGNGGTRVSTKLVGEIRRAVRVATDRGGAAALLVPAAGRHAVRAALARHLPLLQVLADEEVVDEPGLDVFTTIAGGEVVRAA
jgi:flagellar biosynthesis protein FlhA